ncbi:protein of unknown function [Filimonas lacunae]|uniref:DUF4407 domain-containing protein n=1 Tax=Filimonas lacunae TaxID=477680 RepID=A0A173M9A9_9BACT|nr:DUF4407 domain-containing protein [Filimonas lacunae]BAV04102.1 hypothetical protein FLA_0081 [Filimonas lacunae]SIT15443.1 protein of unknown function [Filimonas lacunae]
MDTIKKTAEAPVKQDEPDSFSRFLWWLATVDTDTIKECGPEKERYRIIGVSVLVTWLFATLAWGYFFSTVISDDWLIALLSLFFGFAVLAIDRNLIAAMGKNGQRTGWLPVVFRLALAITIGMFLSQPIILMLFKKDINTQIALNKEKKLQTYRQKLTELNAPLVARYQAEITNIQKRLQASEEQVQYYKDSYIKETDGTGGSGKIGEAAVARVKRNEYEKTAAGFNQLQQELKPQLSAAQDSLRSITTENQRKETEYAATLTDGFLTQVEALNDLISEHPPLQTRYRLVILIITLIEVMPVLSKLLLPKGEYEERIAQQTALGMYKAELAAEREKALQQHYATSATEADKASIDQFFAASRTTKEATGQHTIDNNHHQSYTQLWKQFKNKVFTKKEL